MSRARIWPLVQLLAGALTLACGYGPHNDQSSDGCSAGSAGCPCAEDNGCDGALECVDGSCQAVDVGESTTTGGADATAAAMTTTASTSGASETSETGDSSTTDSDVICSMEEPEVDGLCDAFNQDCPEGQKCAAYDSNGDGAWDSFRCVCVMGDGQHGDPCTAEEGKTGVDDCAEGVMCWYRNDELNGTCVELCTGAPDNPACAPPDTTCPIVAEWSLNLCLQVCHPVTQDCPQGSICIGDPNGPGFLCIWDDSGGTAPEGTPCEFANVCNPGNICVNPDFYPNPACQGSLGCCAPYCDLDDVNACAGLSVADAECVAYHEPGTAPPGLENVGVCGVV